MTESDFEKRAANTCSRVDRLLARIAYPGHRWKTGVMERGAFLQLVYDEPDIAGLDDNALATHSGRKWYVSPHATDSEVMQTALKAALTSSEHRVREHFLVDGLRIFGPHLDVEALLRFAREHPNTKRRPEGT